MSLNHNELPPLDIDWHYDNSGRCSYIMLSARNGDIVSCTNRVVSKLREKGIRVPVSGTSFHPADDGVQYQRYIRLGVTDETRNVNLDAIRLILD